MESTDSFNPSFDNTASAPAPAPAQDGGGLPSPIDAAAPAPSSPEQQPTTTTTSAHDAQTQHRVHEVLHSDVGVSTLLNRLKASIASARVGASPPP